MPFLTRACLRLPAVRAALGSSPWIQIVSTSNGHHGAVDGFDGPELDGPNRPRDGFFLRSNFGPGLVSRTRRPFER